MHVEIISEAPQLISASTLQEQGLITSTCSGTREKEVMGEAEKILPTARESAGGTEGQGSSQRWEILRGRDGLA